MRTIHTATILHLRRAYAMPVIPGAGRNDRPGSGERTRQMPPIVGASFSPAAETKKERVQDKTDDTPGIML
jgi:hypothetical protein